MKRICTVLLCLTALLLTACGAQEAEKDHYYEILDSTGTVLYTVKNSSALDTLDGLLGTPMEDMEHPGDAGDVEPLYTYAYWQEKTLLAGQDPDAGRDYEELMRILVPAEGETITIQVFPDVDALEGLNRLTKETVDLEELLSSTVTVSQETAEALRAPEQFVE